MGLHSESLKSSCMKLLFEYLPHCRVGGDQLMGQMVWLIHYESCMVLNLMGISIKSTIDGNIAAKASA